MTPETASALLAHHDFALAVFHYRVACMVQDNVRADPDRSFEATLLAGRQRAQAADGVLRVLIPLLDAALRAATPTDGTQGGAA